MRAGAIFRSTCELPHIMGGEKCARPFVAKHKRQRGCTMRTFIGPAVLVAIGLMWSVAATSKLVPVPSEEAATSPDVVTVGLGKSASAE